jgi:uncharacterized protein
MKMRKTICLVLGLLSWSCVMASEVIPPAPKAYFNDYAQVVPAATASRLNQELEDFERKTSNQILVAIYPKMQSDSSIEDYTVRVAESWKAGRKTKDNGAVLFVFIADRKMYVQVGYGLEGVLPDALAKRIIDEQITPFFKTGNYAAGLSAGVNAILAATRGEYKGTGRTVAQGRGHGRNVGAAALIFLVFGIFGLGLLSRLFGVFLGVPYRRRRYYSSWGGWTIGSGGWGGWSGGGGGGFGGGGFGGGGFSGGGGGFGGGGAGGSW